eukprot:3473993-Rhodomonas_salina.1
MCIRDRRKGRGFFGVGFSFSRKSCRDPTDRQRRRPRMLGCEVSHWEQQVLCQIFWQVRREKEGGVCCVSTEVRATRVGERCTWIASSSPSLHDRFIIPSNLAHFRQDQTSCGTGDSHVDSEAWEDGGVFQAGKTTQHKVVGEDQLAICCYGRCEKSCGLRVWC